MLVTETVREEPTTKDDVYAFHILGEVTAEDMEKMGSYMNRAFEEHEKVSMLMIFDHYDGSETTAGLDWESLSSRVRSIKHVEKYVVVGAPESASKMIEFMGKILPIEAKTFPLEQEREAWAYIGATRA